MLLNDDSLNNVAQVMVDDMTFDELVDFAYYTLKKDMSNDVVLFHTNVSKYMKDNEGYQVVRPNEHIKNVGKKDINFVSHPDRWYINYYRCEDCDIQWEMEWDADCDDKCPKCHSAYTPYKSEKHNEGN